MKTLLRLLALFRPYALWMAAGVGLSILVVLANIGLLALSGWFIAAMALSGLSGQLIEYFTPAAGIRALAIIRTAGRYAERLVTHEATLRLLAELRVWFYQHLEPLAPARLQYCRGGDLLSRIRADIDSLDNFYLRVIAPTVAALVTTALVFSFMTIFSIHIALIDLAGLALAGVALPLLGQRLGRRWGESAVAIRAELRSRTADATRGLGELLVYQAASPHMALIEHCSDCLIATQRRQIRLNGVSTALTGLTSQLAMWLSLVIAIPLVVHRDLEAPDLAMIAFFVLASFESVSTLPLAFQALGETMAAACRIFEIVDATPAVTEPAQEARAPRRFDVVITGLWMRYAPNTPWALENITVTIPHGTCLGIIGASGSGKTSLLNVVLRFWEYQEGSVTIGGVSLRDLSGETMRSLCAVVAQQTHLFNTSIRQNLLLARPDADEADLRAALDRANILDEILTLPLGMDTIVGETGSRLSGGQARRLAIARAVLKDAPILILDEPTEGLDALSEQAVVAALTALMQGRTTLFITHRLENLHDVDCIMVLRQGHQAVARTTRRASQMQSAKMGTASKRPSTS